MIKNNDFLLIQLNKYIYFPTEITFLNLNYVKLDNKQGIHPGFYLTDVDQVNALV